MLVPFIPIWEKKMFTNATFKIVSWDEEPFDEPEDGPRLTGAHIKKSFHGDLSGTGNLMYVMMYLGSGNASFSGFEKVVGSLGGRTGSFVLRHTGSYDGEKATAEYEVVPGSGTERVSWAFGYRRVLCWVCRGARNDAGV